MTKYLKLNVKKQRREEKIITTKQRFEITDRTFEARTAIEHLR